MPGVVAGVLKLFDLVGLGQPWWYVGRVKLLFCALSLAVPAAMYWTGRRHFGEAAARVALLAGAFWYELVGFAHKPLTEFVATAPLLALLALLPLGIVLLVLASVVVLFAVGVFDALTWGRGLFSYLTNLRFNMVIAEWRVGESRPCQYPRGSRWAAAG